MKRTFVTAGLTLCATMSISIESQARIEPGAVTGLERETVLYQAFEASENQCELASRFESLRISRRPGGSETSFDVTSERLNEIGRKGLEGVVSFQERDSVVRVKIVNPERLRESQLSCDQNQRDQNAIDQFNATVEAHAFLCAMKETKASAKPDMFETIEEKLLDLMNMVNLSPGLRVKVRGGRDALLREISAARAAISKQAVAVAHDRAKSILAAVDDGTSFPKGCAPGALYLWEYEQPTNQAAR